MSLPINLLSRSKHMEQLIRHAEKSKVITMDEMGIYYMARFRLREVIEFLIRNKVLKRIDNEHYVYIYKPESEPQQEQRREDTSGP